MEQGKVYRAIGLMSGTSLDGVDAALLETDGHDFVRPLGFLTRPYEPEEREQIRKCLGKEARDPAAEKLITQRHIEVVKALAEQEKVDLKKVELIGFHGQTVYHNPAKKKTVQIGDAKLLASETGVPVVSDFRSADVAAGGQGAPLLPLYHAARVRGDNIDLPVAVLNIGGVANVTWIGDNKILAFDTGPGNALINDWISEKTGADYDPDGAFASQGKIDKDVLAKLLGDKFFEARPPKSLDRDHWTCDAVKKLSVEDGAATLAAFTVEAVKKSIDHFPVKPRQWLVAGGGRHNNFLMDYLRITLAAAVNPVEHVGWNGDATEAEGFAYLAVRSLLREPLSLPETTGIPAPLTGGILTKP
jgi:anhydro-N-acetylmuramic acid kinase